MEPQQEHGRKWKMAGEVRVPQERKDLVAQGSLEPEAPSLADLAKSPYWYPRTRQHRSFIRLRGAGGLSAML